MVCCVVGCPNKLNIQRKCFTFPRTSYKSRELYELAKRRLSAWIKALRITSATIEILYLQRVCFRHFIKGRPASLTDESNPDWIPSRFLGVGANRVCEIALKRKCNLSKKHAQIIHSNLHVPESIQISETLEESLEIGENERFGGDGIDYDEPNMEFVPVASTSKVRPFLNTCQNDSTSQSGVEKKIPKPIRRITKNRELGVKKSIADSNKVYIPANSCSLEQTIKQNQIYLQTLKRELKNKEEIIEMYEKKRKDFETRHNASTYSYETSIKELELKVKELKTKLRIHDVSFEALQNDNEKVLNLTGLPNFELLNKLYEVIEGDLNENSKTRLKKFDSFVISLMKLRMDLPISYLSYVFGMSPLTISRFYRDSLAIMNLKLGPLVKWPDDEALLASTPSCFKEIMGNKCIVLIHFLEVLIKNLKPPVKGLQSVNHTISVTNESIIEKSGFFDKITEQHIVLSVKDMFEESQKDNEQIQSIKHMAKKTEDKVLDMLKDNFKILFNRQPVNGHGEIYSEFTVRCCCALANLLVPELLDSDGKEIEETVVVISDEQEDTIL
ncbi:uncharacterized protein LOC129950114 isoform X2 [Eupeodes corollae]|uniref:uncharacterized protein LOC129950114 isoform X2 n=1 Tax=Eupeodes corollae TaxID=290404 RepID=UPI0024922713|nr:uncharacterized protein LOC129950114 isoform X2 [Eupeodes corollae]